MSLTAKSLRSKAAEILRKTGIERGSNLNWEVQYSPMLMSAFKSRLTPEGNWIHWKTPVIRVRPRDLTRIKRGISGLKRTKMVKLKPITKMTSWGPRRTMRFKKIEMKEKFSRPFLKRKAARILRIRSLKTPIRKTRSKP